MSTQKNADGTAKNALDVKDNIMGGKPLKDKYIVIEYTMKQEQIAEKLTGLYYNVNKRKKAVALVRGFSQIKQDWENAAKTVKKSLLMKV